MYSRFIFGFDTFWGAMPAGMITLFVVSYRPARLHRLAESIPWNRFLGFLNIYKCGLSFLSTPRRVSEDTKTLPYAAGQWNTVSSYEWKEFHQSTGKPRGTREGCTRWLLKPLVETEANGDSTRTNERGLSLVGLLGSPCQYKRFLSCLGWTTGPIYLVFCLYLFSPQLSRQCLGPICHLSNYSTVSPARGLA
jgi:hypothetical protein